MSGIKKLGRVFAASSLIKLISNNNVTYCKLVIFYLI